MERCVLLVLLLGLWVHIPPLEAQNFPQILPVTATVKLGGQVIALEVARTELQQAIGLMGRRDLPAQRGMLFPFDPPRPVAFWMGNCLISLDMVFVRKGKIVSFRENAAPCPAANATCPRYSSKGPIDQVIELRAGQVQVLKLKVNDPAVVTFLKES